MAAPAHIARENGKKGGRPKGAKSKTTIERELVLKDLQGRIKKHANLLLDSQFTIARGLTHLFKIDKKRIEGPRGGVRYEAQRPVLVTNLAEIHDYLEGLIDEGDMHDDSDPAATYYYITTTPPNNQAIDSLLDRTFGTATKVTENKHSFESFGEDDIRSILSVLPKERQDEVYAVITAAIADAELLRSSEEVSGDSA